MKNPYYTSSEYRQPGDEAWMRPPTAFEDPGSGGGRVQNYVPAGGYQSPFASSGGAGWSVQDIFGTDPTTAPLMGQWSKAMSAFNQPTPNYGDIEGLFWNVANQKTSPQLANIISRLANFKGSATAAANPYSGQYKRETEARIAQLKEDPMTAADDAAYRARYIGNNAFARDTAKQRALEEASARGHGPTDGATLAMLAEVERNYGIADAQGRQALYEYVTNERERRRSEALAASAGLAAHGEGAANRGTQVSMANLQARLSALVASGQMSQQEAQRIASNALAAGSGIAGLRRQEYQDALGQQLAALQISALPRDLARQEQSSLYAMLNGIVPSQQSVSNQYGNLLNGQMNSDAANAAYWQQLFGQIGYSLPGVLGAFGGGGGAAPAGVLPPMTGGTEYGYYPGSPGSIDPGAVFQPPPVGYGGSSIF